MPTTFLSHFVYYIIMKHMSVDDQAEYDGKKI